MATSRTSNQANFGMQEEDKSNKNLGMLNRRKTSIYYYNCHSKQEGSGEKVNSKKETTSMPTKTFKDVRASREYSNFDK